MAVAPFLFHFPTLERGCPYNHALFINYFQDRSRPIPTTTAFNSNFSPVIRNS